MHMCITLRRLRQSTHLKGILELGCERPKYFLLSSFVYKYDLMFFYHQVERKDACFHIPVLDPLLSLMNLNVCRKMLRKKMKVT